MADPSDKAPALEEALAALVGFDRRHYIREGKCVPVPIGCGGEATEFKDDVSRREYTLSGLCQSCQDKVFADGDN
jgi:hypothetical protein